MTLVEYFNALESSFGWGAWIIVGIIGILCLIGIYFIVISLGQLIVDRVRQRTPTASQ